MEVMSGGRGAIEITQRRLHGEGMLRYPKKKEVAHGRSPRRPLMGNNEEEHEMSQSEHF